VRFFQGGFSLKVRLMAKLSYSQKLLDPRWQQMRLRVYERDGFSCRTCKSTTKTLHAHHSHYHPYSEGPWDYDIETIITLCVDCHSYEHLEVDASKANVFHALAKIGYWSSFDLDSLCDILSVLTKDDLIEMFLEKANGSHKNS
jgi:hypothetical protein